MTEIRNQKPEINLSSDFRFQASVFHIPAGLSFLDELADGIYSRFSDLLPEEFSKITVLLPNNRSAESLKNIFLKKSGRTLLLPRIKPLGEADGEIFENLEKDGIKAKPITALYRKVLLTRLVAEWQKIKERNGSLDQAAYLAAELAKFLDEMQREKIPLSDLRQIVPVDLAGHWQITLSFFEILIEAWPGILKNEGLIDIAEYTNLLLERQSKVWQENPPQYPVIIAGSTGSIPATAELIKTVANMPNGYAVLPGLDMEASDRYWQNLDASHAQSGLKKLLQLLKVDRQSVKLWTVAGKNTARLSFASEILRPTELIKDWATAKIPAEAIVGIENIAARNQHQEALIIAMRLRLLLEEKGKTAALVTTDRTLARIVTANLQRWNVDANDSAGKLYSEISEAIFLRQIMEAALNNFSPVSLLAVLKNPFFIIGLPGGEVEAAISELEIEVLRGIRNYNNLRELKEILAIKEKIALAGFIEKIESRFKDFIDIANAEKVGFETILRAHIKLAEELAFTAEKTLLWQSEEGLELADYFAKILRHAAHFSNIDPKFSYMQLLESLLGSERFKPKDIPFRRIEILGTLEARLQNFDLIILGGMNEGSWPVISGNPWLNNSMKEQIGLFTEEKRKSLSAHDFYCFLSAKNVVITRAEKKSGEMALPSSLLLRMQTLLVAAGLQDIAAPKIDWPMVAENLDKPLRPVNILPPNPKPQLSARPNHFSVTQIEKLIKNPYGIYASKILALKALPELDQDPEKVDLGNIIHKAMEIFGHKYKPGTYQEVLQQLLSAGNLAFARVENKAAFNLWWPKYKNLAGEIAKIEIERRKIIDHIFFEIKGETSFLAGGKNFTITAKADRIELSRDGAVIIDYKTGTVPDRESIETGIAPQLLLEALILKDGGFDKYMASLAKKSGREIAIAELCYWKFFADEGIKSTKIKDVPLLLEKTKENLRDLLEYYLNPGNGYVYAGSPETAKYDDYRHLSRVDEWQFN